MSKIYTKSGNRYLEVNPYGGVDFSIVLFSAIRYALGRNTYVPNAVIDFCQEHWTQLGDNNHFGIIKDVILWLNQNPYNLNYKTWKEFAFWGLDNSSVDAPEFELMIKPHMLSQHRCLVGRELINALKEQL